MVTFSGKIKKTRRHSVRMWWRKWLVPRVT
jgi:hypothetical protein